MLKEGTKQQCTQQKSRWKMDAEDLISFSKSMKSTLRCGNPGFFKKSDIYDFLKNNVMNIEK